MVSPLQSQTQSSPPPLPPVRDENVYGLPWFMLLFLIWPVSPPAVLVRFLTRRFIGEYASNASKCFQILVVITVGWRSWLWSRRAAFISRLLPVQPEKVDAHGTFCIRRNSTFAAAKTLKQENLNWSFVCFSTKALFVGLLWSKCSQNTHLLSDLVQYWVQSLVYLGKVSQCNLSSSL